MDAVVSQVQDLFEGQIDFHGQRLSDTISTTLLCITSLVALIFGSIKQDIHLTMWIGLAGTLFTMLIVVPPWPVFNQHPEPWIGSKSKTSLGLPPGGIVVGSQKIQ